MLKNKGGLIMIIRKKTIYLASLILILVMLGFINHELSKDSITESSNDYQKYEEELTEVSTEESELVEIVDDNTETIEVVDSKDNEINTLSKETNAEIGETLTSEQNIEKSNYFAEYRLSRDKMRSELIDRLNDIVKNDKSSKEVVEDAQKEIIEIGKNSEKELLIEGLLGSKGFDESIVFIGESDVRIVISKNEFSKKEVAQILEIVTSETEFKADNIKIINKNS
ncbi:SpoIIIAH-like family protein [Senegalia massiliensis]|uniref:SpoIIIAH-like family protein n=2 Tax=Senegalia massiliensis TaxID=1720316 RepID=A0A845QZN4_9CLOT|nr:SpoIIIAH-like family protein [Senegalia massiliensis]